MPWSNGIPARPVRRPPRAASSRPSGSCGWTEELLSVQNPRLELPTCIQEGFEIRLPHRYALWRDELKTVALEIRPLLLISSTVEPTLEAAFLFPLAQVLQLRVGGRAYTFQGELRWGVSTGLSLTL